MSPLALINLPLLRALAAETHGRGHKAADLAKALERDVENTRKSLKRLVEEGMAEAAAAAGFYLLTGQGRAFLAEQGAGAAPAPRPAPVEGPHGYPLGKVSDIPIGLIDSDPALNPRTTFAEEELAGLAASIADKGVVQPILVRPLHDMTGHYSIVAGERRWRASKLAGLETIPALVRDLDDAQALEIALIENIQRVDLSPIEEARTFRRIIDAKKAQDPAITDIRVKEVIAEATRKTVRYVEQRLALLVLPAKDQARLELPADDDNRLTLKEARWAVQNHTYAVQQKAEEAKRKEKRQKELAGFDITADRLLMLAEIEHKCENDAVEHRGGSYYGRVTEVAHDAKGSDLNWLKAAALVVLEEAQHYPYTGEQQGRFFIKLNGDATDILKAKNIMTPRVGTDALKRLRGAAALPLGEAGKYSTAWLNGPFDLSPAEAGKRAKAERVRQAQEAETARQTQRAEKEATAGRVLLELALRFTGDAGFDGEPMPTEEELVRAMRNCIAPLPLALNEDGDVVDANGDVLSASKTGLVARRLLLAHGVNRLAGLVTPPVPATLLQEMLGQPAGPLTRQAFEQLMVDRWQATGEAAPADGFAAHATAALDRFLEDEGLDYAEAAADPDWTADGWAEIADGWSDDGFPILGERDAADQDEAA